MSFKNTFVGLSLSVIFLASANLTQLANARPEYAAQHGFSRCTSCHASPVGGGIRNLFGKSFGLRGFSPGPYGTQDTWSADLRGIYFYPNKSTTAKGGAGIMAGLIGAQIPVTADEDGKAKIKAVLTHNIGGFPGGAGGPRETYLKWERWDDSETGITPQYILIGRFLPPFGLMTDEHRTYTKIQTKSTWNDIDMGALFSGDPASFVHYDLGLLNGQKTAGAGFGEGNATMWGASLNIRVLTPSFPVGFGLSGLHYEKKEGEESPSASALYLMVSLDRITSGFIKAALISEYVIAQGFNSTIQNFFTNSDYQTTVENKESEGIYTYLNWELTDKLSFVYKYDYFVPDRLFMGDKYERHGAGLKYYFGPNLFTQFRIEQTDATHPTEEDGTGMGATDAGWVYLQLSI